MSSSVKSVLAAVGAFLTTFIIVVFGISLSHSNSNPYLPSPSLPQQSSRYKPKFPAPTFETKNLTERDQQKIQKFKKCFEYWGNVLKYDKSEAEKLDKIIESELSSPKCGLNDPVFLLEQQKKYGKEFLANYAKYTRKNKKGICRHFAALLQEEGRNLGIDIYYLSGAKHAANLYKLDGKWYVADLTAQVGTEDKNKDWFYRMPLDYYLKTYMRVKNETDRKNIEIWFDLTHHIPLDEFLSTH